MKYAIVVSEKDLAGLNTKEQLLSNYNFKKLDEKLDEKFDSDYVYEYVYSDNDSDNAVNIRIYTVAEESIHCENIDEKINCDAIIFATRHASKKGVKALCVHVCGNWGEAQAGGKTKEICIAMPNLMSSALIKLTELSKGTDYEDLITQESTHHGPYVEKPCMFIEIGSEKISWQNKIAGKILADTIINILTKPLEEKESLIVIGGGHYNQLAHKLVFKYGFSVGHIIPKHMLEHVDAKLIKDAFLKNNSKIKMAILEWKGLGSQKQKIKILLEELVLPYKRYDHLKKELKES